MLTEIHKTTLQYTTERMLPGYEKNPLNVSDQGQSNKDKQKIIIIDGENEILNRRKEYFTEHRGLGTGRYKQEQQTGQ